MNRLQWFRIAPLSRKSLKELSEKMLGMPYGKANRVGFSIENVRSDLISGRFIERTEFTEVIQDPFGVEVKIDRVRFDTTDFTIYTDIQVIECHNPGRNLKGLLNEIAKASNYDVVINRVEIPLREFAVSLESEIPQLAITKAIADDIVLSDGVLGQLQAAGEADIRGPLQSFLGKRKFELNRIRIVLLKEDERLVFEVTRAGAVSSAIPIEAKFRKVLRKHVAALGTSDDKG